MQGLLHEGEGEFDGIGDANGGEEQREEAGVLREPCGEQIRGGGEGVNRAEDVDDEGVENVGRGGVLDKRDVRGPHCRNGGRGHEGRVGQVEKVGDSGQHGDEQTRGLCLGGMVDEGEVRGFGVLERGDEGVERVVEQADGTLEGLES